MNHKRFSIQHITIIIAIVLILAAIVYQRFENKQETIAFIQHLEPAASRCEPIAGVGGYPAYKLWDKDDTILGYAVAAGASGYGGPLSVLVSLGRDGTLKNVIITENCETPAYFNRVLNEGYLNRLIDKQAHDPFEPGQDLDVVSGATYTVKGIAQAVRKGSWQVGKHELGLQIPAGNHFTLGWQELGLMILYGLVFIAVSRRRHALRPWVLALSILFLGFFLNAALSLANLTSLVSGNLPAPLERPFWYLLTLGVLIPTLLWGRNFYCAWLCPFGGLQEGIYKVLGFMKFNPSPPIISLARKIRWSILWAAVLGALIFNNPGIASYEPFAISFGGQGNLGHWLTLGLVLITGIFIYRVWCRLVCPVGTVLNFLASVKGRAMMLFRPNRPANQPVDSLFPHPSTCPEVNCSECTAGQAPIRWADLPKKEKIFLGILIVYALLIIITLSLNILSI